MKEFSYRLSRFWKSSGAKVSQSLLLNQIPTMSEGIFNRSMVFCETLLSKYNTDELYASCDHCDLFFCICCQHSSNPSYICCHHYPVVFTDGACSRNGSGGAFSGIGGSFGDQPEYQWSIPVDDSIDSASVRTNQRAELLASIEGVRRLGDFLLSRDWEISEGSCSAEMVVATDSEYVCKGVTGWMPKWKVCFFLSRQHIPASDTFTREMDGEPAREKSSPIRISSACSTKPSPR